MSPSFARLSDRITRLVASPASIMIHGALLGLSWALEPVFGWSSSYNLAVSNLISDETLMVGLFILAASLRDSAVVHAKANELLHAVPAAREDLIGVENQPEQEIP